MDTNPDKGLVLLLARWRDVSICPTIRSGRLRPLCVAVSGAGGYPSHSRRSAVNPNPSSLTVPPVCLPPETPWRWWGGLLGLL